MICLAGGSHIISDIHGLRRGEEACHPPPPSGPTQTCLCSMYAVVSFADLAGVPDDAVRISAYRMPQNGARLACWHRVVDASDIERLFDAVKLSVQRGDFLQVRDTRDENIAIAPYALRHIATVSRLYMELPAVSEATG